MPVLTCAACRRDYDAPDAGRPGDICPACRAAPTGEPTLSVSPVTVGPAPSRPRLPTLPGYDVLAELGRGGMGVVYKARQIALNRLVALKVILVGQHAGDDERQRFRTEAETVARLHHPNIVQVYELGEWQLPGGGGSTPFLSLEFCGGGNLHDRLGAGPLAPHLAAGLIECLARAIHDAHGRHVVHRDLKPANILFSDQGVPKVADFGMAKKLDEQGHTKSGTIMGTPSYMSPEQAGGKTKSTGPATDIWALGAILYECLSGRPPYLGETPLDTIMQVINEAAPPLPATVPAPLAAVCLRCLAKRPEDRYPTAAALADDLRRYLGGQRVAAFGLPPVREARSFKGTIAVGVLAIAAVLLGVGAWIWRGERRADGDDNGKGAPTQPFRPAFRLPDHVGELFQFKDSARGVEHVAFAPDGTRVAGAGADGVARVWSLEDHELVRELKGHAGRVTYVAFDRAGKRLLTASEDGTARLWDMGDGRELKRFGGPDGRVNCAIFGPEEREVLLAGTRGAVEVWDVETGKLLRRLNPQEFHKTTFEIALRPGRRQVLAQGQGTGLAVAGLDGGAARYPFKDPKETDDRPFVVQPFGCAYTAAGGLAFAGDPSGELRLWDADGGAPVFRFREGAKDTWSVATSPARARALAGGKDKIYLFDLTLRTEEHVFQGHEGRVQGVAFSPDGRHFVSGGSDGTVRVWGLPAAKK